MVADNINLGGTAIKPVGWDRSIIYNFKMLLLFSNLELINIKQIQQYCSDLYIFLFYSHYFKMTPNKPLSDG